MSIIAIFSSDEIKKKVEAEIEAEEAYELFKKFEAAFDGQFAPGGDAWHPKNRKVKNVCYCENFGFGCQENIRKEKKEKEKARKKGLIY